MFNKKNILTVALSVLISSGFVAVAVSAATTISTNINTGGTLTVTGASTLTGLTSMGQASSTRFSVFDTAYFGGTATTTINSAGNVSVAGTLGVTGASTLSSTLSVTGLTSMGQASSTRFSVFDTAYFGGTATTTISSTGAVSAQTITVGAGTSITKHISATASLDFPVIGASSCQSLTITVTGAADGDTVSLGVPAALANASSTFSVTGFVSAANTVTARVCQVAASASSDPAAATVRADVWQH